ncbi:MAG: helix-turn-helix domain-containing protein [Candidatus Andersenbacteria bacterium]
MEFVKELKKLGLKDKEAAVYLACLELGPSPVQQVSRKARVVRATTYVILESLMQMGLVTKFKEGKKTLFSAEPPRQLTRLLEKQKKELEEKEYQLDEVLPELQVIMKTAGDRPSVRYFEGKEGLHAIRQEIVMYSQAGDTVYNFTPYDHLLAIFPEDEPVYLRQRVAKGVNSKTLITTKSEKLKQEMFTEAKHERSERRFISPEMFPSTSGMTIYRNRIAIGTFSGKLMGVVIESDPMSDMMKRMFEIAWIGAGILEDNKGKN